MSVSTTADKCLAVTNDCLKMAFNNIQAILEEHIEGSREFNSAFISVLTEASASIAKIRIDLKE